MEGHLVSVLVLLVLVSPGEARVGSASHNVTKQNLKDIDEFVEGVLECWGHPGMSIAVVKDGEVLLTEGYGVKNLDTQEPFTAETMMTVASITKQFSATLCSILLEEHPTFTMKTPVRDILGDWFYYIEGFRSSKMTTADILSHRAGLPYNDPIKIYGYTIRQFVERMRFLEFGQGYRDTPWYNTIHYGVASYIAETLAGGQTTYEDLIRQRILTPAGMTDTTYTYQAEDRWEDEFASGYQYDDNGDLREIELQVSKYHHRTISAGGGLASNAIDMARWLQVQLNDGKTPEGDTVFSTAVLKETHSPTSVSRVTDAMLLLPDSDVHYSSEKMALGFREGYYRGYRKIVHSGNTTGFVTLITQLPELDMGVFTGMNGMDTVGMDLIHQYTYDTLMGIEPWVDVEKACEIAHSSEANKVKSRESRSIKVKSHHADEKHKNKHHDTEDKATKEEMFENNDNKENVEVPMRAKDTKMFDDYVGRYGHYAYGNVTVYVDEDTDALHMTYGPLVYAMTADDQIEDVFHGKGLDIFWFWDDTLTFMREDGVVNVVEITFSTRVLPLFYKDLDFNYPPPPPEICP